ncbi:HAD family hydrolase [Sphingomonas xinjiangensis]|uniref:Membrane protein n=1 Tax=Sphingomonas xinjiangensis TaxID=643568 RepID=A0A840YBG9_9SPHN|nr:HAD family hydrolase [Sphingomonas xinjiangensis]MBB5710687.1 membrane protein [Sphingomonas xinjiangensis]
MPLQAVLFDLDGTLVDSNEYHVAAWETAFRDAGHAIPAERIREQIGKGGDNLVPALLPDLDEDAVETLGKAEGDIFQGQYIERVRPFPGARDLIARVTQAGLKAVLASSAGDADIEHYTKLLDAEELIALSTGKDDVKHSKPHPDIFAAAVEKAGIAAADCLVIGDTPYDVEAAKQCGIGTIGLLSGGFSESDLRAAGAIAIYPDAAALLAGYAESPLAR